MAPVGACLERIDAVRAQNLFEFLRDVERGMEVDDDDIEVCVGVFGGRTWLGWA